MKKYISLFIVITLLITASLSASACGWKFKKKSKDVKVIECPVNQSDFEILPTMNTVSNAKNQVWVGTFQLIWNDLIDELVKRPVEFSGAKSVMADNLNKKTFTKDDLNESSYYKKFALASLNVKKEIETAIKEKFNETSDILGLFDWTPAEGKYILYAMLKKDFQYIKPFDKLQDDSFNGSQNKVKYFGIDDNLSSNSLRHTIDVLFYNGTDDFAISLKSKQGDTVYLYRTNDEKTLDVLYEDMIAKSKAYEGDKWFTNADKFKAPMIEFKSEREFPEICNKPIKNSNFIISRALETVQFKMDETGVKLKSEAGMMVATTAMPSRRILPRYFYFNDRYVIFLQEKDKPYFAMKIEDVEKIQK